MIPASIRRMGAVGIWLRKRGTRELAKAFAAGAALLLASLANFLTYNDYPYLRIEVALLVLGMLALLGAMAPFYLGQRQWGRSLLEGLLAAVFVDFNTDSMALVAAAGLGVAAFTWWKNSSLLGPMTIVGSVVLITTFAGVGGHSSWIKTIRRDVVDRGDTSNKAAIIHIVLDEHTGLEGLAHEGMQGQQLRGDLRDFYLSSGFVVYGGAYSEHYRTISAIPSILNYGDPVEQEGGKRGVRAGRTKHLDLLGDPEYRLTIFQSEFADYCARAKFHKCITYDSSRLQPTLAVPMGGRDRAALILFKFLDLSQIFREVADKWNIAAISARSFEVHVPLYPKNPGHSSTVSTLEAMNVLSERLSSAKPGDAFFVHLLMPHFPYVVRRDCSYLPWSAWDGLESNSTIQVRRRAYYEQVRCTARKVQELLQALSQSPAGNTAVAILHGDHGSRIVRVPPNEENFGRIHDSDMIAGFSTLFAIKAPGLQPAYFRERQPVSALLRDFAASGFLAAPHPEPPEVATVYLADSDWKPVRRVALPPAWLKAQ